jgi:hypothetical protein
LTSVLICVLIGGQSKLIMDKKLRKLDYQQKFRLEQDVLSQTSTIVKAKNELIIKRDALRLQINDLESEINALQKRQDNIELLYETLRSIG